MPEGLPSPMPGGAGPPGGPPPPSLPKSPIGGPGGPGASPMMSPGGGAGARANSMNQIRAANDTLLLAVASFDQGSKEQQAILRAITALNTISSRATGANMVPAALAAMAQASSRGPLTTAPPPGMAGGMGPSGPGGPPPMPGGGAEIPEAA